MKSLINENQECCSHINVKYKPIENDNGLTSMNWECVDCKHKFWPDVPVKLSKEQKKCECSELHKGKKLKFCPVHDVKKCECKTDGHKWDCPNWRGVWNDVVNPTPTESTKGWAQCNDCYDSDHCHGKIKECRCRGCAAQTVNFIPSPTKPDIEEWEKEFDRKFTSPKFRWSATQTKQANKTIFLIKSFIRQEKEKSYNKGVDDMKDMVDRNTYEMYSKGEREIGRHSAYSEIKEILEILKGQFATGHYGNGYNDAISVVLSKLKERINNK